MTLEELVAGADDLIALPRIYLRLNSMLDDPRYGTGDIARVISHDPVLAGRLLGMANSVSAHKGTVIESTSVAVSIIGTRQLRDLLLATTVARTFSQIDHDWVDLADFWHHSVYCGILSRLLAVRWEVPDPESLFIAGLMHDIGEILIYQKLPEAAREILMVIANTTQAGYEVEREHLGFDHAELGGALLRHWGVSERLCAAVGGHHRPGESGYPHESRVVAVPNRLASNLEPGHKLAAPRVQPSDLGLDADAVEALQLQADVEAVQVFTTLFTGTPLAR